MQLLVYLFASMLLGVCATPIPHDKRQQWTGMYSEEFSNLGCRPVIFIFARETIAPGNMVRALCYRWLLPQS